MDDGNIGWVYSPYSGRCEETADAFGSESTLLTIMFAGEIY